MPRRRAEITISGCLLSNGYAGYQVEEAVLDAVDGKPADGKTKGAAPMKWILDGGGNLRRRVGEKVQVVGKSEVARGRQGRSARHAAPRGDVRHHRRCFLQTVRG
jgi:hypothetical protein